MEFKDVIAARRTIRRFKQVQVLEGELREMLDAARQASCGGNMQRLRYIVIQDKETVEKIFKETAWGGHVTPKRNPEIGKTAPLTFVAVTAAADTDPQADAGAAVQSMELAAWNIGVGCCWIGAYNRTNVTNILDLPEDRKILFLLAVGYPDELPVQEDIGLEDSTKYYLDENDVLHVPKYTVDAITEWR
jgi:nitroreductase